MRQVKRHRGFLPDSPFWRNWFVALFLIGFSFVIIPSANDPQTLRPVSYGLLVAGALVLVASAVHVIGVLLGKW